MAPALLDRVDLAEYVTAFRAISDLERPPDMLLTYRMYLSRGSVM
jgi:hypothetical protein